MKLATCDRHWDREAVGLFEVAGSEFGISSWMCEECVGVRADQAEVRRRALMASVRKRTTKGRKTRG